MGVNFILKNGLYPQWENVGKNKFFTSACLSLEDSFFDREEGLCPFMLPALGVHLMQLYASPVHASKVYESSDVCCILLSIEYIDFLVFSFPSGCYSPSAFSPIVFPEFLEKEIWWKNSI